MKTIQRKALLLITTFLDEALAAIILLAVLPSFGFQIPVEYVIATMAAIAIITYALYKASIKVYAAKPALGVEEMMGAEGVVIEPLTPRGRVRIGNELWSAESLNGYLSEGTKVKVVEVEGLLLKVKRR